ncbi:hypothetical protein BGX21_001414 [Mortierella sp. AD011]|nr:hypothetical protein BGX21_001414 [Mortierella sp. AD011]
MAKKPKRKTQNHSQDNTAEKRTGMAPTPYTQSTETSTSRALRSTTTKTSSSSKAKGAISIEQASTSKSNRSTTATKLKFFCVVEKESTSFPVDILDSETVGDLKKAIKEAKKSKLDEFDADKLTLKIIPGSATKNELPNLADTSLEELDDELQKLSTYFVHGTEESRIRIIVKPPQQVEEPSKKFKSDLLLDVIEKEGLAEKAIVKENHERVPYLSNLSSKELIFVLRNIGTTAIGGNYYRILSKTAAGLQMTPFQDLDLISSPSEEELPVTSMSDLFVRQAFKELYDEITDKFNEDGDKDGDEEAPEKKIIVTGTADIGKSSFLVYFAIRLLATSSKDDPPIIIMQRKEDSKCFAFGGLETVREGDLEYFEPFLGLVNTWYLVDSSPNPILPKARTIFAVSPKTLYSDTGMYKEVVKKVNWTYYMAPWDIDELKACRNQVRAFNKVPEVLVEDLFKLIGGMPRYVLRRPEQELCGERNERSLIEAKDAGYCLFQKAIDNIQDRVKLSQYIEQNKVSLHFSSCLLHHWPTKNHDMFELKWASEHIMEKIVEAANNNTWHQILKRLVDGTAGEEKGVMFELYVRRIMRRGSCSFQARSLTGGKGITVTIPPNPETTSFYKLEEGAEPGTIWIPICKTFACVDILEATNNLFQVTMAKNHGINGDKFTKLLKNLQDAKWIRSSEEANLIFIVPLSISEEYTEQNYLKEHRHVDDKPPKLLQDIKQYVIGIDLVSDMKALRKIVNRSATYAKTTRLL